MRSMHKGVTIILVGLVVHEFCHFKEKIRKARRTHLVIRFEYFDLVVNSF